MTELQIDYAELIEQHAEDIVDKYADDYDNFVDCCAGEDSSYGLSKDEWCRWRENLTIDEIPEEFAKRWVSEFLEKGGKNGN